MRPAFPSFHGSRAGILVFPALFAAFLAIPSSAAEMQLGASSFQFLKLSLSPRSTAMGGAGVALAEGPGDSEINPAAAARSAGTLVLGQEYPPSQFGTSGSHVSWSLPWDTRRITLHARYLGFEKIPGWDADNAATTPYDAYTMKAQAGLAGNDFGFAWGASAAYALNNIANATYAAGLVNAGLWREIGNGLSVGASVMNLDFWTSSTEEAGERVDAPTSWQAGIGYQRPLRQGSRVAFALDARKVNEEDPVFPLGVEWMTHDVLFLRTGYPLGDPDNGPAFGVGLVWARFAFNYAYKGHSVLSGGHGWTLEIRDL